MSSSVAEEQTTPNFTSVPAALHVSPVPQRLSAQVFHVGVLASWKIPLNDITVSIIETAGESCAINS